MKSLIDYMGRLKLAGGDHDGQPFAVLPWEKRFIMGAGATERIVDPGIEVVSARLADPLTGELEDECAGAIARWYTRVK